MPFRLLNPAAAQCADTAVAQRRRSSVTTALQQSRDNAVVQCEGITRAGRRCAVTAKTDFRDGAGRLVAQPLRQGSRVCLFHLDLFCTVPVSAPDDFVVFFLDLETSGLDVLHDEVLEIAITAHVSSAQFATTVLPRRLPEGLGEMVGCALLQVGIEVMRKSAPFSNTYANCAAESAVAAVGSMFSVLARAL